MIPTISTMRAFLKKYWQAMLFAGVAAGVVALNRYVVFLDNAPFAYDEGTHYLLSLRYHYHFFEIGSLFCNWYHTFYSVSTFYPPLYYILQVFFMHIVGCTADNAVMMNSVFLVMLMGSTYATARRIRGRRAGITAACLVVLMPGIVGFSRVNFPVLLMTVLVSATIYFLFHPRLCDSWCISGLLGVVIGLGLLTKQTFPLYLIGPVIALFLQKPQQETCHTTLRDKVIRLGLVGSIGSAMAALWYVPNLLTGRLMQAGGVTDFYSYFFFDPFMSWYRQDLPTFFNYFTFLYHDLLGPVWTVIVVLTLGGVLFHKTVRARIAPFIFWFLMPLILLTLLPTREARYLVPILPAAVIMIVCVLDMIRFSWIRNILLVGCIMFGVVQTGVMSWGASEVSAYTLNDIAQSKRHGKWQAQVLPFDLDLFFTGEKFSRLRVSGEKIGAIGAIPFTPLSSAAAIRLAIEKDSHGDDRINPFVPSEAPLYIFAGERFFEDVYHTGRVARILADSDILFLDTKGFEGRLKEEKDDQAIARYMEDLKHMLDEPENGWVKAFTITVGKEQDVIGYFSPAFAAACQGIPEGYDTDARVIIREGDTDAGFVVKNGDIVFLSKEGRKTIDCVLRMGDEIYTARDFLWQGTLKDDHLAVMTGIRPESGLSIEWRYDVTDQGTGLLTCSLRSDADRVCDDVIVSFGKEQIPLWKVTLRAGEEKTIFEISTCSKQYTTTLIDDDRYDASFSGGFWRVISMKNERLRQPVFSMGFTKDGQKYHSTKAVWHYKKIDQMTYRTLGYWKNASIAAEVVFQFQANGEIRQTINLMAEEPSVLTEAHAEWWIDKRYRTFIGDQGECRFPRFRKIPNEIQGTITDTLTLLGDEVYSMIMIKSDPQKIIHQFTVGTKRTRPFDRRVTIHSAGQSIDLTKDWNTVLSGSISFIDRQVTTVSGSLEKKMVEGILKGKTRIYMKNGRLMIRHAEQKAMVSTAFLTGKTTMTEVTAQWELIDITDDRIMIKRTWPGRDVEHLVTVSLNEAGEVAWKLAITQPVDRDIRFHRIGLSVGRPYTQWRTLAETGTFDWFKTHNEDIILTQAQSPVLALAMPLIGGFYRGVSMEIDSRQRFCSVMSYDASHRRLQYFVPVSGLRKAVNGVISFSDRRERMDAVIENARVYYDDTAQVNTPPAIISADKKIHCEFRNGYGRLFLNGQEITKGFGMYTSLFSDTSWHDSGKAVWEIIEQTDDTIIARGRWLYVPITQTWEISIIENVLHWRIIMDVHETVSIKEMQSCIMLDTTFTHWCVNTADPQVFSDVFTDTWIAMASSGTGPVTAIATDGGRVRFDSQQAVRGERLKVLNTDTFFASRVLQVTRKPDAVRRVLKPGRYTYFQGTITLDDTSYE